MLRLCPIWGSTRRVDAPILLRSLVVRSGARKHLVWAFADQDQACREESDRGPAGGKRAIVETKESQFV